MAKTKFNKAEDLFDLGDAGLGDLFGAFDEFQENLIKFSIAGAGAAGAGLAWGYAASAAAPYLPAHPAVLPALKIVAGVVGGQLASDYIHEDVGTGVAVGLVASGLVGLVNAFMPGVVPAGVLSAVGEDDTLLLSAAPVEVEALQGAPVEVESLAGVGSFLS